MLIESPSLPTLSQLAIKFLLMVSRRGLFAFRRIGIFQLDFQKAVGIGEGFCASSLSMEISGFNCVTFTVSVTEGSRFNIACTTASFTVPISNRLPVSSSRGQKRLYWNYRKDGHSLPDRLRRGNCRSRFVTGPHGMQSGFPL